MLTTTTPGIRPAQIAKFFFLFFSFIPQLMYSQIAGTAPVSSPTGGFKIDGSVTKISTAGDWRGSVSGTYVLNISGTGVNTVVTPTSTSTAFIRDPYNTTADKIFSSGSKFDDGISALKWSTGKATAKNDIHNGMFHIGVDESSTDKDRWLVMGGDRYSTQGTSYIDFEFSQRTVQLVSGGTFSYKEALTGVSGIPDVKNGKTPKDFVLSIGYSNGGSTANVYLYVWEDLGSGTFGYVQKNIPSGLSYAQTNLASVPVDFYAFGAANYDAYAFVEAAVNISALYRDVISGGYNDCSGSVYKSMFIKTKASDVMDAALKDFIEPQNITLTFGGVTIAYAGPYCQSQTISAPTISGGGSGATATPFSYENVTPASGAVLNLNTTTGAISSGSDPGTYKVKYAYTTGGCSGTAEATVVIRATPTITLGAIPAICKGTNKVSIPYSQSTGSPSSFSIDFFSGINDITDQSFSPLEITGLSNLNAGTYTGTLTVKTSAGCVSSGSPVSITINEGTPFTLQAAPDPVCPGATVTFTGPTAPGGLTYTYSWSGGNTDNDNSANYTAGACGTTVTATLTLTNDKGCVSSDDATVNVNDVIPPTFTNLPANVTLGIGDALPTAKPTANDNCKTFTAGDVTYNDVNDNTNCTQVIKRTFTATDDCGNSVSYTQLIIRVDRTAPVITCSQSTLSLTCGTTIPTPTVTETGGGTYKLYFQDVINGKTPGCSSNNVTRTWTAVDASGNISSPCVQTITFTVPTAIMKQSEVTMDTKKSNSATVTTLKKQLQLKAYPNPYNNKVNFSFTPNKSGYAVLDLVDLNGRKVATIYKGNVIEGQSKTVSYENNTGAKVPLVYRLTIGSETKSGKIIPTNN